MPVFPKRARENYAPASPPLRPFVGRLCVSKTFMCEGHRFEQGAYVTPDSPLVQAILREYPTGWLEAASH